MEASKNITKRERTTEKRVLHYQYIRFGFFFAVKILIPCLLFYDAACSVDVYIRFKGTYRCHLQSRIWRQYVPPRHRLPPTKIYRVISHKTHNRNAIRDHRLVLLNRSDIPTLCNRTPEHKNPSRQTTDTWLTSQDALRPWQPLPRFSTGRKSSLIISPHTQTTLVVQNTASR
jgi:hypothetical protein